MEKYMEKSSAVLIICFIALPLILTVQTVFRNSGFELFSKADNGVLQPNVCQKSSTASVVDRKNSNTNPNARLLNGLLSPAFKEESCLSRYQSHLYYKERAYNPSPYLISKLRYYESLHERCGPKSRSYTNVKDVMCKYLVWTPANGLGNRMVSMASAFLYAIITNRVFLVEFNPDMEGLFCEPFPNSSWLLPNDFPNRTQSHNVTHVYLQHSMDGDRNLGDFHCDRTQEMLNKVGVLILQTDQYFVPSLFMMSCFKSELSKMFSDNGVVFYNLGHYLFHPSNEAWGLITRFYDAYLAKADERIGFQIRVFRPQLVPVQTVMDQVMACALQNNVLPQLDMGKVFTPLSENRTSKSKAVFVASLNPNYAEELRVKYWTRPTLSGDVVAVYQSSHEEYQKFNDSKHNMKAWAEIYLLSLCDVLLTSSRSSFGYVAHGLAGLKPWVLAKQSGGKTRNPPCRRDVAIEPCFHYAPKVDCNNTKLNIDAFFPPMNHCVDVKWGLKMAEN